MIQEQFDAVIIGAGPAGSCAAACLKRAGLKVLIVEAAQFPRFVIGESLLPQSMDILESAGLLGAVESQHFQRKNGALFVRGREKVAFEFSEQFSRGYTYTYQVPRADFDQALVEEVARQGVTVLFQHSVTRYEEDGECARIELTPKDGELFTVEARFVLDGSGYGRVLARLLELETPAGFPERSALFTHIEEPVRSAAVDYQKISVCIHPRHADVWYWAIPFSDGRTSVGVVAASEFLHERTGGVSSSEALEAALRALINEEEGLKQRFSESTFLMPARQITGYAASVRSLYGTRYAILGNAGEFLDPVFSSGVTVALKSAMMAAELLVRQLKGESVDWEQEYQLPLKTGIDTFRAYVTAWYDNGFQKLIFSQGHEDSVRRKICSILAGYVWDRENPFVHQPARKLASLITLCDSGSVA